MSYEEDVLNFLAKQENLHIAFEVADYVQKLKEDTQRKFWSAFSNQMRVRIENSDFREKWKFDPYPMSKLKANGKGCWLIPKAVNKSVPRLVFQQSSHTDEYRLLFGLFWDYRGDFSHPVMLEMKQMLIQRNLTKENEWWFGWNWYKYRAQGEVLIAKMHQDLENTIDEVVDDFWQFFLEFQPLIEDIIIDIPEKE